MVKIADVDFDAVDAVFCCLPHGTTQATLASLPSHVKIVDLSADFRLKDVQVYGEWCVGLRRMTSHAFLNPGMASIKHPSCKRRPSMV